MLGALPNIHKKSTNFRAKRVHGLLMDNSTFDKSAPTPPGTLEMPERQTDNSTFDKSAPTPPGTLEMPERQTDNSTFDKSAPTPPGTLELPTASAPTSD